MKLNKTIVYSLITLIVVSALYRIIPGRPYGFAPQFAMALFAGSVIKDKRLAFALPLLSMLISDLLYEGLYAAGLSDIQGFYSGMFSNYILFVGLTMVGFYVNHKKIAHIITGSLVSPTIFFIISNFLVWAGNGGYQHPKTFAGLMMTYSDGLPFYQNSLLGTLVFSGLFFGGFYLASKSLLSKERA